MSDTATTTTPRFDAVPAIAAAGFALLLLVARYVMSVPEEDALREFLVVCLIVGVTTALVFGRVIPRSLAAGSAARTALTLSLLALLLVAVYWSAISPVLAVGAVVLARATDASPSRLAFAIGLLAIAANVAMVIVDNA